MLQGRDYDHGKVISVVPGYTQYYNMYNIKYDEDQAIHRYILLDDYRSGDLKILKR